MMIIVMRRATGRANRCSPLLQSPAFVGVMRQRTVIGRSATGLTSLTGAGNTWRPCLYEEDDMNYPRDLVEIYERDADLWRKATVFDNAFLLIAQLRDLQENLRILMNAIRDDGGDAPDEGCGEACRL